MGAKLPKLLGTDSRRDAVIGRHAQLVLGFRQRQPQPPPSAELPLRTPQLSHFPAGIAADQRIVGNQGVHDVYLSESPGQSHFIRRAAMNSPPLRNRRFKLKELPVFSCYSERSGPNGRTNCQPSGKLRAEWMIVSRDCRWVDVSRPPHAAKPAIPWA